MMNAMYSSIFAILGGCIADSVLICMFIQFPEIKNLAKYMINDFPYIYLFIFVNLTSEMRILRIDRKKVFASGSYVSFFFYYVGKEGKSDAERVVWVGCKGWRSTF